jgi:hypothetical protein
MIIFIIMIITGEKGETMHKPILFGILLLILIGGLVVFGQRVSAQNPAPTPAPLVEVRGDAQRLTNNIAPNAIVSLPMSNPFCSQPDPSINQCAVNVRYWQANDDGTGTILAYVLFSIDGKLRYRSNAFFENFVTYSYDMIPGGGIKVTCGLPNEGGFGALYGRAYTVDVKAYNTSDVWVLDDQLAVKCPAFNP